jgi:predicted RNA-binding protein YlqC (UPF0109 family)
MPLKELISTIAEALVDDPDSVEVREIEGDQNSLIELRVAKGDIGKVIGKEGRTASRCAPSSPLLRRSSGAAHIWTSWIDRPPGALCPPLRSSDAQIRRVDGRYRWDRVMRFALGEWRAHTA